MYNLTWAKCCCLFIPRMRQPKVLNNPLAKCRIYVFYSSYLYHSVGYLSGQYTVNYQLVQMHPTAKHMLCNCPALDTAVPAQLINLSTKKLLCFMRETEHLVSAERGTFSYKRLTSVGDCLLLIIIIINSITCACLYSFNFPLFVSSHSPPPNA